MCQRECMIGTRGAPVEKGVDVCSYFILIIYVCTRVFTGALELHSLSTCIASERGCNSCCIHHSSSASYIVSGLKYGVSPRGYSQ